MVEGDLLQSDDGLVDQSLAEDESLVCPLHALFDDHAREAYSCT